MLIYRGITLLKMNAMKITNYFILATVAFKLYVVCNPICAIACF